MACPLTCQIERQATDLQIAVLVEEMRREGYEVLVSRPRVITRRDENDVLVEPYETLYVEVPEEYVNGVMKSLAERRGEIVNMQPSGGGTMIEATIPTRGLIGFEFQLLNMTSGHGILSHLFKEYAPRTGEVAGRKSGTLVSMDTGVAMAYSLDAIARVSEACAGDYARFGYVDIRLAADTLSIWLDLRRSMLLELLAKGDVSGPTYAALEQFTS